MSASLERHMIDIDVFLDFQFLQHLRYQWLHGNIVEYLGDRLARQLRYIHSGAESFQKEIPVLVRCDARTSNQYKSSNNVVAMTYRHCP